MDPEIAEDSLPSIDSEDENITAQKLLESLQKSWMNEKFSPEILPHQTEVLELMIGQLDHMEENMATLDKNDFRMIAHRMEIERIRYLISSYLRYRIKKIEYFTKHILNEEESRSLDDKYLCEEETQFAKDYLENVESFFQKIALQYIPGQQSDADQRIVRPNLMSHVFLKANHSVAAVMVGVDEDEVDLAKGSQHIIPYNLISDLLLKNKVQLI